MNPEELDFLAAKLRRDVAERRPLTYAGMSEIAHLCDQWAEELREMVVHVPPRGRVIPWTPRVVAGGAA